MQSGRVTAVQVSGSAECVLFNNKVHAQRCRCSIDAPCSQATHIRMLCTRQGCTPARRLLHERTGKASVSHKSNLPFSPTKVIVTMVPALCGCDVQLRACVPCVFPCGQLSVRLPPTGTTASRQMKSFVIMKAEKHAISFFLLASLPRSRLASTACPCGSLELQCTAPHAVPEP